MKKKWFSLNGISGFTLIELMIVIAILAILTSILIPNFSKSKDKANLEACKTNLRNIATALEMYAGDNNGLYCRSSVNGFYIDAACPLISEGYLKGVIKCPSAPASVDSTYLFSSTNKYVYCHPGWNGNQPTHPPLGKYRPLYYLEGGFE